MRGRFVFVAAVVACTPRDRKQPSPPDGDYVGADALVDRTVLKFGDAAEALRFDRARGCFAARASGWSHFPLRELGNFIEEDWCRGSNAAYGCDGAGIRDAVDVDWAAVGTLHYDADWPAVFGVQIDVGHVPADDWGVSVSVSSNGDGILGDGTHVDFRRGDDEAMEIHLGTDQGWDIDDAHVAVRGGEPWQMLATLRASPESLRDEGVRQWEALGAEVGGKLERGEVLHCIYGPYEGGGIPPACLERVPLDPEQTRTELARIRAEVDRVTSLLRAHHVALHRALLELLPADCVGL